MGLMIGAVGTQVSDNVRGNAATYDSDWSPSISIRGTQPGIISDYDATSYYADNGTTSTAPLNLLVRQNSYAWVNAPDNKYIMMQYFIKNVGTTTYTGLYAGISADWDIPAYANNKGSVDLGRRLGYVWSTDTSGVWAGIQLLSHTGGFTHYALDNLAGGGGGLDISTGFTGAQKYTALSTSRNDAGTATTAGNDILEVVSSGGFTLMPGDSVEVTFALMAGDSLTDLQSSADAAQIKYDATFTGITQVSPIRSATALTMIYPNPASGEVKINFSVAESNSTEIAVYSATGEKVKVLLNEGLLPGKFTLTSDLSSLASGNYVVRMTSGAYSKGMTLNIVR